MKDQELVRVLWALYRCGALAGALLGAAGLVARGRHRRLAPAPRARAVHGDAGRGRWPARIAVFALDRRHRVPVRRERHLRAPGHRLLRRVRCRRDVAAGYGRPRTTARLAGRSVADGRHRPRQAHDERGTEPESPDPAAHRAGAVAVRATAKEDPPSMTELSVVMPCLNEAETLATCITKARASMESLGVDGEIVVADNGSTDGSQEIATSLGRPCRPRARAGLRRRAAGRHRRRRGPLRDHGRRRRQLRAARPRPVRRGTARRRRPRHGQPLRRRHRARRHAGAAPLPGQPRALVDRPGLLQGADQRLPLRDPRVLARPHPRPRAHDHGHGVRQRDGGAVRHRRADDHRGAHDPQARRPQPRAASAHVA